MKSKSISGAHQFAVDGQRAQRLDVRERDVQEEADRLPRAEFAQVLRERDQVIVVHPDQVVGLSGAGRACARTSG